MPDIMDFSNPTVLGIWGATVVAAWLVAMAISYIVKGGGPPKVLPLSDFEEFPLIRKEVLSHDTARFTIGLPKGHVLGLPTGQHVTIQFKDADGKAVQRSYTPTTDDTVVGEVSLVIKVYRPMLPKFPEGGKMSQYLDSLKIGDMIRMKGPKGHLTWIGKGGNFTFKPTGKPLQERKCKCIGMIVSFLLFRQFCLQFVPFSKEPPDEFLIGFILCYLSGGRHRYHAHVASSECDFH